MEDIYICSVCGQNQDSTNIAMKWNQDFKKGWCLCIPCRDKYRGDPAHGNKIEKDSYNYFTTTIRQLLVRHGFSLNERTLGSLRMENYVKWSLRATAPNDFFLKVHLEVKRNEEKDYSYYWTMKTFDPDDHYLKEAESDRPNVPVVKDFLNDFLKHIGSDPYLYFRATLKSILNKHNILISETLEGDDKSLYKGMYINNKYRWEAEIKRDFKWGIKLYALKGKSKVVEEYQGGSFAITPLKEFFNKITKKY
jgi:hypothetical protein